MRVLCVAQKNAHLEECSAADEAEMVLIGYLAFLDPPKASAAEALKRLKESGVAVKVLTGDNEKVTACVCGKVGLDGGSILLGADLEEMNDETLAEAAERATVFAKLSPTQKERVVRVLRAKGHTVGFMGDGTNDAPAMRAADVGISVDTAVDIAKESAGVILLKKDLTVVARRRGGGQKDVCEHDKIYQDHGVFQFRQYAFGFGGERVPSVSPHAFRTAHFAESRL